MISASILQRPALIVALFSILAVSASIQAFNLGKKSFSGSEKIYTHYNNYIIFKQSHFHFLEGEDLYIAHPEEQWDLYKYSPAFSIFFGLFAYLPDGLGLTLWNLFNALFLAWAIYYLPKIPAWKKAFIALFCALELMTSLQNAQSNAMMAAFIIGAFGHLERGKQHWAALFLVASVFVKLFGLVAFALILVYPRFWWTSLWAAFFAILLFFIPLIGPAGSFWMQYESWWNMLQQDHSQSLGYSLMGLIHLIHPQEIVKTVLPIVGVALFLLSMLPRRRLKLYPYRLLLLASILL